MTKMDVQQGNGLMSRVAPNLGSALRAALVGLALMGVMAAPGVAQESPTPPLAPATEAAPSLPQTEVAPLAPAPADLQGALPPGHPTISTPADAVPPLPSAAPQPGDVPTLLPHDLSPIGMFRAAHWVVKAVMISLAFACFVTWTVFLFKSIELLLAQRRLRATRHEIDAAPNLPEAAKALSGRSDPAAFMALSVLEELRRSDAAIDPAGTGGVKERTRSLLDRIEAQAGRHLRRGTGVLATIGSTAPFVGLFGTVWGIMNSFIGIAETKTTNLAVVAPGIAEALLATAIGLVAAIPAVMIYNVFARAIANYRLSLGDAGAGIERLVSRDLDFRTLRAGA